MSKEVITFDAVTKSYKIFKNRPTTFKEQLINRILRRNTLEVLEYKILENASFVINKGETVGIIGVNGAGKSTTLKLIANIISPDKGCIKVEGTVSSLLEIGAGFQSDLTGKENVFLYGSILGLSKKLIRENYYKIVEFSELENFMDTAVKNYSSGMYMRLAFSVAIHVNPDILLIDEVMAVGDANFQKKCLTKINEFKKNGKTIVFVSHDMSLVRELCDRVVFIDKGGKIQCGETDLLVNLYFSKIYGINNDICLNNLKLNDIKINNLSEFEKHINMESFGNPSSKWGSQEIEVDMAYFSNANGYVTNVFNVKDDIVINLELEAKIILEKVVVGFAVFDEKGVHLSGPNSKNDGLVIEHIEDRKNVKILIRQPPFLQGTYYVTIALYDFVCKKPYTYLDKYFIFHVINVRDEFGCVGLDCEWVL